MQERPPSVPAGRPALAALALCALLPALGSSIANVALPALVQALGARFESVQWVVLAYLLASTTLVVSAGRLGDLFGRRRLLLGSIVLFGLGAGLAAGAPGLWSLVAARALQGAGAAGMMALGLALVAATVPAARSGQAMGLLATLSAFGTALGPALGGLLLAAASWRALFLLQLPLALLALALAWRFLPADAPQRTAARFDALGALALAFSLAAYALALSQGGIWGLRVPLLGLAALGLALFVGVQRRTAHPLVDLAQLRAPRLRAQLAATLLVAAVLMTTLVIGPFHLAQGLGLGAALLGWAMAVGPACVALAGWPAGRAVDRWGAARVGRVGLLGMLAGCGGLALAPLHWGLMGYLGPLMLLTSSYALFQAATPSAVLAGVAPAQRGLVSGLLNLARNLGLVSGAALMGAVFAHALPAGGLGAASGAAVAAGLHQCFGLACGLLLLALGLDWRAALRCSPGVSGELQCAASRSTLAPPSGSASCCSSPSIR